MTCMISENTVSENNYIPDRLMIIQAHPDDIEFTNAGTAAKWVQEGCHVCYVLCTSGDAGIADLSLTREQVQNIRETEARNAAVVAGAEEVVFLREPDGLLEATLDLRKRLVREIRRFRPEVIMCGNPTVLWGGRNYINHPDHRAAALAAIDATFPAAGQPHVFQELREEGLEAHKPRKVYVFTRTDFDTIVNIDDSIDIKIQALKCHVSQMNGWDPGDHIRQHAEKYAADMPFQYGEPYKVITLISDEEWAENHPPEK